MSEALLLSIPIILTSLLFEISAEIFSVPTDYLLLMLLFVDNLNPVRYTNPVVRV